MPTAMVTFNGRVTLPAQVRKDLGIEIGDNLDFVEIEKGCFAIHTSAASHDEACRIPKLRQHHSDDSIDEIDTLEELDSAVQ